MPLKVGCSLSSRHSSAWDVPEGHSLHSSQRELPKSAI